MTTITMSGSTIPVRRRPAMRDAGYRSASAHPASARPVSARPTSARPAPAGARLRLTRRGRIVLSALASGPLLAAALVLGLGGGNAVADSAGAADTFAYVTVSPGESLWELAKTIAPADDPRDVIAELVTLNQLSSADVAPGQRLAVPAHYAP